MVRTLKLELQALRLATKVDNDVFTHTYLGSGSLWFNQDNLAEPKIIVNYGRAGILIYETIMQNPVEFYYRSYANKYGKGVVPKELIDYAYRQCTLLDDGRLALQLDFSKDSLMRKYQGKPEVRVIDDLIFEPNSRKTKANSIIQCAFFHLFNTRLKDEKWVLFQADLLYALNDQELTFDRVKEILKEIQVL